MSTKTKEQISKNMKAVHNKDSEIELLLRKELWNRGFDWETKKHEIKSRQEFWIPKIERTIERDKEVTQALEEQGWLVMRFWGKEIKKNCAACADKVVEALKER